MAMPAPLRYDDAAQIFTAAAETTERIGIEVECALVEPRTGRGIGYHGRVGTRRLVESVAREFGGEPVLDSAWPVAAALPGGAQFSLELGGALEYASPPFASLARLIETTRADLRILADLAGRMDIAVVPAGMVPFTPVAQIPWIPKPRIAIMRDYFRRLGPVAAAAEAVMGLTLSTQTSLDYLSEADLVEKLRLLVAVTPFAAAMFVNSPLLGGEHTGWLSRRMEMWRWVDPGRCGILAFAIRPGASVGHIVDWAMGLPMIYRATAAGAVPAPAQTFRQLVESGFGDGRPATMTDWESHLSQVWPQVRPRRTLESRAFDGLGWESFPAAPAFWTGLAYHAPSRRAALDLLASVTAADLDRVTSAVAREGLAASVAGRSIGEVAAELLGLARLGLRARAARGTDPPSVVDLLDPLAEVVRTGRTFAERCLAEWEGDLRGRPPAFVRAHRV
jgi:glutamate--cysteine ligase